MSRVIGREAENAHWLLHENVPVLVNARKMRPADEVEVAAHRVLTGEPVHREWSGAEVCGRENSRPGHSTGDSYSRPLTAAVPSTPVPVPSTPVGPRQTGASTPGAWSRVSVKDKTGEEDRSRSPQPRGNAAILHEDLELRPTVDPVEELATALLNDNVYTSDAFALLLQLYTKYQHGV